jgi:hypothetical protein
MPGLFGRQEADVRNCESLAQVIKEEEFGGRSAPQGLKALCIFAVVIGTTKVVP